jgi:hypothetical protein
LLSIDTKLRARGFRSEVVRSPMIAEAVRVSRSIREGGGFEGPSRTRLDEQENQGDGGPQACGSDARSFRADQGGQEEVVLISPNARCL